MFARKVAVQLKPNSITAFTNLVERDILPWLRQQEGFRDLIILALTNGREVATISFWDHKGNAEAYSSTGYPAVVKILEELLDGTPYIKTFDVVGSTCHGIAFASEPEPEAEELIDEADLPQPYRPPYETSV